MTISIELPPLILGLIGGVISWFLTQFVAEPLRRFLAMRRDIAQHLMDYENVRAPRDARGGITAAEDFTEQHAERLRDAQKRLREFGTQMLSFAQTDPMATKLIRYLWRYDPLKAGRSLVGFSHDIAVYGDERAAHRRNILDALRIKPLSP
jgi:hypothetical protein